MELKLQKKEAKIKKFSEKHNEFLKERVEDLHNREEKRSTKVDVHKNIVKQEENNWFK
jgi:hypothetical protein